jgi:hypothetical protein
VLAAAGALAAAGLAATVWVTRREPEVTPPPAAERALAPDPAGAEPPADDEVDDGFGAFGDEPELSPDALADELDDQDLAAIDRYIAQKGTP